MKTKPTITIGIPAYNAEKNISDIIISLISQKVSKGTFKEIIVYSDQSKDNTVLEVKRIRNNSIKVIDGKKRLGFAGVAKYILSKTKSDITILLNDDIEIKDNNFVKKLILPFTNNPKLGLVGGNIVPLKPRTFVEKAATSSFNAYKKMSYTINKGNNKFTCDGKVLALSRDFIKSLNLPKDDSKMGNVDIYLYLSCLKNGFRYYFAKGAKVYFRFPTNIKDFINWTIRNNSNFYLLKKEFGDLLDKEFRLPLKLRYYMFIEFIKNPIGGIFLFFARIYIGMKARRVGQSFNPKWETVATTKNFKLT